MQRGDQADGLRRMLAFSHARTVVAVAGRSGAGRTSCVVNLAAALAQAGRNVVVLDENFGPGNVSGVLGVKPRFDLRHAICGDCPLEEAIASARAGLRVISASSAARSLARLTATQQERAIDCFAQLDQLADVVLIDTLAECTGPVAGFGCSAQEFVVVLTPSAASVTGSYALMKMAAQRHRRERFRILVNRVHREELVGVVFTNMAQAAERSGLKAGLELMGAVAYDGAFARAAQEHASVVEAFPEAAASRAFRQAGSDMLGWVAQRDGASRLDGFMQRVIRTSRLTAAGGGA